MLDREEEFIKIIQRKNRDQEVEDDEDEVELNDDVELKKPKERNLSNKEQSEIALNFLKFI